MSVHRIYNFSAGPAVLPLPVLEEAQRDLIALPGVGMSVLEISHRSKPFDAIMQGVDTDMRALGGIPANYKILLLQGGASLQFSMVPMNLLTPGATADYILTGDWGDTSDVADVTFSGPCRRVGSTPNRARRRRGIRVRRWRVVITSRGQRDQHHSDGGREPCPCPAHGRMMNLMLVAHVAPAPSD